MTEKTFRMSPSINKNTVNNAFIRKSHFDRQSSNLFRLEFFLLVLIGQFR